MLNQFQFALDKESSIPIYKQIYTQISKMIADGTLSPGQQLQTERQLSEAMDITRGTVRAAYSLLRSEGKIVLRRGSGAYVARRNDSGTLAVIRKNVNLLLDAFPESIIGSSELLSIFQQELKKRQVAQYVVRVAWVDCCIECLRMAKQQIASIKQTKFVGILLGNMLDDPVGVTKNFDLIVTTAQHYDSVTRALPDKWDIIEKVHFDLSINSAIEIAQIQRGARVMELCLGARFKEIMRDQLLEFDNLTNVVCLTNDDSEEAIKRQLKRSDVLIICKVYADLTKKSIVQAIRNFELRGGKIIYFEYMLDKGSLLHFDECVQHLFSKETAVSSQDEQRIDRSVET